MSLIPQFNCLTTLTHNETARKAMESYIGILQKAFEHYQNLWEDYIKLQEKCGQCNVHSSSQMTKDEAISQHLNNANVQESSTSSSIPLLKLDTVHLSPINFNSDAGTGSSDVSESHKNTNENNPPVSPVFSRTFLRTAGNNFAKKFVRSPKAVYNDSTSDMNKTHHSIENVSSKHNHHKLEISTTHHVETTFLPNGKKLKQSRLAFYPCKSNEKMSSSVDKRKAADVLRSVEQDVIQDVSTTHATAHATVIENDAINDTTETSEDVIEVSPTQRNVTSKVRRCLKLKRKIPIKHMKTNSPSKNKCPGPSAIPEIIDIDFGLCPSPKHTSTQMEDDESLMNTAVNTLKDKVNMSYRSSIKMRNKTDIQIKKSIEAQNEDQLLINKVQRNNLGLGRNINDFACEDETFYLPAEQTANQNDMDDFNLDDTENKPPEKKRLSKRKADVSEQLNMRCKADRAKLNGWDCWECREYYKSLSLPKEELEKRRNQCSRHRHKYERPNTPEGFWDPEFPETLSSTYRQN